MNLSRQSSLYRAANAAGFATVWHDDHVALPGRRFAGLLSCMARLFR